MHSKSDNIKFTSYNDVNEVVDELFDSIRSRYQDNLEKSMRASAFIFDSVQLMHDKFHRVNFRRWFIYWFSRLDKKAKAKINPKNKDDERFQYAVIVTLNYGEIQSNPERVSYIRPFINKYKWKGIDYS